MRPREGRPTGGGGAVETVEFQTTTDGVPKGVPHRAGASSSAPPPRRRRGTTGRAARHRARHGRPPFTVTAGVRRRFRTGAALALGLALTAPTVATAGQGDATNPFVGHRQFIDCEYGHTATAPKWSAWHHYYRSRGAKRKLLAKIARTPTVKWFTANAGDPVRPMARMVERYVANVDHPAYGGGACAKKLHYSARKWQSPVPAAQRDPYVGDYPVLAFRALNDKRCGADADPRGTYRPRIDALARELSRTYAASEAYKFWSSGPPPWARWRPAPARPAAVILEPDALGLMGARSRHCLRG